MSRALLFIILYSRQPSLKNRDSFLQDCLGSLHGEPRKEVRVLISAHERVKDPVRQHPPYADVRISSLHHLQLGKDFLLVIVKVRLSPSRKDLPDTEERSVIEQLRFQRELLKVSILFLS